MNFLSCQKLFMQPRDPSPYLLKRMDYIPECTYFYCEHYVPKNDRNTFPFLALCIDDYTPDKQDQISNVLLKQCAKCACCSSGPL